MNVKKIRGDFPILKRKINGKRMIYFDNAATTQKPIQVIEKMSEFYKKHYANVYRGLSSLSQEASEMYENAYKEVAKFIKARPKEIVFTKNTTESINLVAYSYGLNKLKKSNKILVSVMEHNSNLVPWQFISNKTGCQLEYVFIKDFEIDINDFKKKMNDKVGLVAITHVSNVLGSINEIKEIVEIAHRYDAKVLVDAAQSVAEMRINVKELDADFLAFSSHKMLGPTGVGVLYGKEEILEKMEPFMLGGGVVEDVDFSVYRLMDIPRKFEAGTPNIAGVVGFTEAIRYINKIGMRKISRYLRKLTSYFLDSFSGLKNFKIVGKEVVRGRVPIFSFVHERLNPHDISRILDRNGIVVRSGYHCAHLLMKYLNLFERGGTVRASLYIYNTKDEIDIFFDVLEKLDKT